MVREQDLPRDVRERAVALVFDKVKTGRYGRSGRPSTCRTDGGSLSVGTAQPLGPAAGSISARLLGGLYVVAQRHSMII